MERTSTVSHSSSRTIIDNSPQAPPLPHMPLPSSEEKNNDWEVKLEGMEDPKNWSDARRWYLTFCGALLALNVTFASSAPSGVILLLMKQYNMSSVVGTLTISLFVAGYCVGPLLWGPLSEQFGRRPIFITTFAVYAIFQGAGALAQNTASILAFRFIGGIFAAAPLTNSGALISDLWDAKTRGKGLAMFALAPFAGPALGPTVAGFIAVGIHSETYESWRWLFWVLAIFAAACWVLIIATLPETYSPILLKKKAAAKRAESGDERYWAPMDREEINLTKRLEHVLVRPFVILFTESMLMAITLYMSFIYGCMYLLFTAYPIVFAQGHGFNAGISGLMFLPLPLGGATAVALYLIIYNPRYIREADRLAPASVPPEYRLEMCCIAAPLFAASFFWFAWTSDPEINFWAPMMAGWLIGFSISWLSLGLFNYIIDAYLSVAASALAANTIVRSLFGAAFPLFGGKMYEALHPQWASSLVGFIAIAMTPIPFVLMKYGPTLRRRSKYAPTSESPIAEKVSSAQSSA